jgi:hypothetical protein
MKTPRGAVEEDGWDLVTCLNCDWGGKVPKGADVCPVKRGGCGFEGALAWTCERALRAGRLSPEREGAVVNLLCGSVAPPART